MAYKIMNKTQSQIMLKSNRPLKKSSQIYVYIRGLKAMILQKQITSAFYVFCLFVENCLHTCQEKIDSSYLPRHAI